MHPVLLIQSGTPGVLFVNGQFCGPMEDCGQAFPCGRDAEIYVQLFPFGRGAPLTAGLELRRGEIRRLYPQENAYALLWPEGIIQLELRTGEEAAGEPREEAAQPGVLLRCMRMALAGEKQAELLFLRGQELPDLTGYEAAVELRFAPRGADPRMDEKAGLMRRIAPNIAAVDAALAMTVPVGPGMKRIERMEIVRTQ